MLLWAYTGHRTLGESARETLLGASEVFVSAVSFAETSVKQSIGKLRDTPELRLFAEDAGFRTLPLQPDHAIALRDLPLHHRDPFDRMLLAQAAAEDLTIISADSAFPHYPVTVVPAL